MSASRRIDLRHAGLLFWLLAFAGPDGASAAAGEGGAGTPGVKTDFRAYPEPPLPKLPKAGGTLVDPTFGTTIMRLTDEKDGKACYTSYANMSAFNRDNTMLFAKCQGKGKVLFRFDPKGFKRLKSEPIFDRNPPDGQRPSWGDAIWSAKERDVIFLHGSKGKKLWSFNVTDRKYALLKDFTSMLPPDGYINELSRSTDDNRFALIFYSPKAMRDDPKKYLRPKIGYCVWQREPDRIVFQREVSGYFDEVEIDKTGEWLLIKTGDKSRKKGTIRARIANLKSGDVEDLEDLRKDVFAPGHSGNGRGTVCGIDNYNNKICLRKMARGSKVLTLLDLKKDWAQGVHVSTLADNEDWAMVNFYTTQKYKRDGLFHNELVLGATDGSGRVRRLVHHRSVVTDYIEAPHGNWSRDGKLIVFNSTWGRSGRVDVFILKVPPEEAAANK